MPTVLAIAAHPDDIEFLMSGTLMLLRDAGYHIHYLNIANGCCGSSQTDAETTAQIRREEAKAAAAAIGATFHPSLCNDLEILYEVPLLQKLASIVRQVEPKIVLTHSPSDYMEDHTNACRLAVTATFARGMPNFPVNPPQAAIGQKVTVYHAQPYGNCDPLRNPVEPQIFINTTEVIDQKVAMLACHASQKLWLDQSQGLGSYLQKLRDLDEQVGRMSGLFQFAEGWRRHSHLGFCDEKDDPLVEALHGRVLLA